MPAYAALAQRFDDLRAGPQTLTHKQAVALAGEAYRRRVDRHENNPAMTPEAAEEAVRRTNEAVAEWRWGSGEEGDAFGISPESAKFFAAIQRPFGPQMLAWETQADIDTDYVKVTLDQALEDLFGPDADALCAEKSVYVDR